jgi:GLPGLI family protein
MKKIKQLSFLIISLSVMKAYAQNTILLSEGRIEFERKVNLYAQIDDDEDESWRDFQKKMTPQFKLDYFDLIFYKEKTLYRPGRENPDNNRIWHQPAEDNIIFTDFDKAQATSQKGLFGETFLVSDSTRKIKWKVTNETKNIAGFECRRVNGLIMDSVYVVAFYTDEILTPGGPESFSGLPGMILGVAIPHEHITWFATKVYAETINQNALIAPAKGKKLTNAALLIKLKDGLKDWGKWANRYIKAVML